MLTFGVIGSGSWGTKVIKAIRALGYDVRVCNRSGEYEDQAVCRDYKTLIPNVDIVWVATHPSTNCEIAAYAIEHGKPTVVEKPVAFTSQQVAALVRASKAKQVPLIVDYIYLFNRGLAQMIGPERPAIVKQPHGDTPLKDMTVKMLSKIPNRDYSALWDWGSHGVAIVLDTFGELPTRVDVRREVENNRTHYVATFLFGGSRWYSKASSVWVSADVEEKKVEVEINGFMGERTFVDDLQYAPLQTLIGKIASLHLRNEYWTNGDLAVEVTDVLERLHKLLPQT